MPVLVADVNIRAGSQVVSGDAGIELNRVYIPIVREWHTLKVEILQIYGSMWFLLGTCRASPYSVELISK